MFEGALRPALLREAEETDFWREFDAIGLSYLLLYDFDELTDICGRRVTGVDDKVRMQLGDLGSPHTLSLQAQLLDEGADGNAFGVLENAAAVVSVAE